MAKTNETAKQVTENAAGVASKLTESGKALFSGTIAVDKMILGQITDGAKMMMAHGRALLGAKDLKTAVDLQVGFVQNGIEQSVANTREVLEFTQARLQDVVDPFRKTA